MHGYAASPPPLFHVQRLCSLTDVSIKADQVALKTIPYGIHSTAFLFSVALKANKQPFNGLCQDNMSNLEPER